MTLYRLTLAVIVAVFIGVSDAGHSAAPPQAGKVYTFASQPATGQCKYMGYYPGGQVTDIADIKPPRAEIRNVGLAMTILKGINTGLDIAAIAVTLAGVGPLAPVAPFLSAGISIFKIINGIIIEHVRITNTEIVNSVNLALEKITQRTNMKLDRLKGYVNAQIVASEKRMVTQDYASAVRLWAGCLTDVTKPLILQCQMNSYHHLDSIRPKFAIFSAALQLNQKLSGLQIRQLEVYLPIYRQYTVLAILQLTPLIAHFCNKHTMTPLHKLRCKKYSILLQREVKFAIEYSTKAVKAIVAYHEDELPPRGSCADTLRCIAPMAVTTGWWREHTLDKANCYCTLDQGTKQKCSVPAWIRTVGGRPQGYVSIRLFHLNPNYPIQDAVHKYAWMVLGRYARAYTAKDVLVTKYYWKQTILSFIPTWKKAYKTAQPGVDMDDVNLADLPSNDDAYTPKFAARLAEEMAQFHDEKQA